MTDQQRITITEFTDPLCSIAWGTEPKRRLLEWRFGDRLDWRVVMGGLVGDLAQSDGWDKAGSKEAFGDYYQKIWRRVSEMTGMPYPIDLAYMAMTTDVACRAVKAAELQGKDVSERVLRRLREAVFFYGTPVDHIDQLPLALAGLDGVSGRDGASGLDIERLLSDYQSDEVEATTQSDWEETRRPNDYVRGLTSAGIERMKGSTLVSEGHERYVLPTFVFSGPCGEVTVPAWRDYSEYEAAIEQVLPGFIGSQDRSYPTPAEAISRWGTMTGREVEFVGNGESPTSESAELFNWGEGDVWLAPNEAAYWRSRR